MNSFFPDANILTTSHLLSKDFIKSFDTLKIYINTFFRPKTKSIFGIHNPVGLRYLVQLRVGLSCQRVINDVITSLIHHFRLRKLVKRQQVRQQAVYYYSRPGMQENRPGKIDTQV